MYQHFDKKSCRRFDRMLQSSSGQSEVCGKVFCQKAGATRSLQYSSASWQTSTTFVGIISELTLSVSCVFCSMLLYTYWGDTSLFLVFIPNFSNLLVNEMNRQQSSLIEIPTFFPLHADMYTTHSFPFNKTDSYLLGTYRLLARWCLSDDPTPWLRCYLIGYLTGTCTCCHGANGLTNLDWLLVTQSS